MSLFFCKSFDNVGTKEMLHSMERLNNQEFEENMTVTFMLLPWKILGHNYIRHDNFLEERQSWCFLLSPLIRKNIYKASTFVSSFLMNCKFLYLVLRVVKGGLDHVSHGK